MRFLLGTVRDSRPRGGQDRRHSKSTGAEVYNQAGVASQEGSAPPGVFPLVADLTDGDSTRDCVPSNPIDLPIDVSVPAPPELEVEPAIPGAVQPDAGIESPAISAPPIQEEADTGKSQITVRPSPTGVAFGSPRERSVQIAQPVATAGLESVLPAPTSSGETFNGENAIVEESVSEAVPTEPRDLTGESLPTSGSVGPLESIPRPPGEVPVRRGNSVGARSMPVKRSMAAPADRAGHSESTPSTSRIHPLVETRQKGRGNEVPAGFHYPRSSTEIGVKRVEQPAASDEMRRPASTPSRPVAEIPRGSWPSGMPQASEQRPSIHIGQLDITVEGEDRPRLPSRRAEPSPSRNLASRLYLRSL